MSFYGDIRARNESAWLLPTDGSRTDHRLRADMRRHADVRRGGPGGRRRRRRRQRPDPAAGPGRLAASCAWTPGRSGTRTPTGSATNAPPTPCTGPTRGRSAASDPVPLGSNNSGRGVGGSMIHYAGYTPRFHPSDFHTRSRRRGRRRLAHRLPRPQAVLPAARGRTARRRAGLALGRPAPLPAPPAPGVRQRRDLPPRRGRRRHHGPGRAGRDHQRPVREPPALHLPRLLPAGLQGQRQGQPADHPHPRRPGARRGDPPGQPRHPGPGRRPHRPGHRRQLPAGRGASTGNGPGRSPSPGTASKPPGCCCCRPPPGTRTGWATTTTRSAGT